MWALTRSGYYADWITMPILALAILASDIWAHGVTAAMVLAIAVGLLLWSFIEYSTHRWIFHESYKPEHWMHHIRPAAYIGIPPWQTGIVALCAAGAAITAFGMNVATGLTVGTIAGYLIYIIAHDRFHHSNVGRAYPGNYWDRSARRHLIHHRGANKNFGVSSPVWDVVFGTYQS